MNKTEKAIFMRNLRFDCEPCDGSGDLLRQHSSEKAFGEDSHIGDAIRCYGKGFFRLSWEVIAQRLEFSSADSAKHSVRVALKGLTVSKRLKARVWKRLSDTPRRAAVIAEEVGVTKQTVTTILAGFISKALAEKVGNSSTTKYIRKPGTP